MYIGLKRLVLMINKRRKERLSELILKKKRKAYMVSEERKDFIFIIKIPNSHSM